MADMEREHVWPALTNRTGAAPTGTHIIFLQRLSSKGRDISNWEKMQTRMTHDLGARGYTFTFIEPSTLSMPEQILLFSRGTILVSSHGAGLTHAMWMQPKSIILEARPKKMMFNEFFKSLAVDFDLTHFSYENRVDVVELPNGSMQLNIDLFAESVKSVLWHSDQIFGSPPGCKSPITIQEATLAHFKVYVNPKDNHVVT
jgi:hypothetical protein